MQHVRAPVPAALATPVLAVRDLKTQFFTDEGVVRAVDGVSFTVDAGEALGIVGESGSGKSVTALSLMRLLEEPARIVSGTIEFMGRDVLAMSQAELRKLRGAGMAMVFQDPMTSLNPVLRIARQLVETMVAHGSYGEGEATRRGVKLLGRMGITTPERAINSYPHQFSGGMRQRVALAMGMSNEPALLIADEPTTALDVTIQAQILELLGELNRDFGTAIVLISHDLGVIAAPRPRAHRGQEADCDRRRAARPVERARRLPLRAALPLPRRALRGTSGASRDRAGTQGPLLGHAGGRKPRFAARRGGAAFNLSPRGPQGER
jgi:peptide/nickel transport system ATP-binding protein